MRSNDLFRNSVIRTATARFLILFLVVAAAGCQPRTTRFELTYYDQSAQPETLFEEFDVCYYATDDLGNVDVIARRGDPFGFIPSDEPCQVVCMRGIWRAVPGRTAVESTQLNTTVSYWIFTPDGGIAFEGAGFALCREDHNREKLTGELERATVRPVRQVGDPPLLLGRARLQGTFRAERNRARVIRILNEMKRRFGPMPRYTPPPPGPL